MIQFRPETHEYLDGEESIPSVTTILTWAGWIDARWYTQEGRDRGTAVHTVCERYARGERIDAIGRPLADLEYVNAFAAWMADTGAYPIETECVIFAELNGKPYAGRFDGLYDIRGIRTMVDIKTGAKAKWHAIQLAAYSLTRNPGRSMALYLRADGIYREDVISPQKLLWGIEQFKEALYA